MKTLIFDTETNGLAGPDLLPSKYQPKITEFYGVLYDDGIKIDEADFLCNIGEKLDAKITQITGLTDEMLKDASPFSTNAETVLGLITSANEVVAHNLSFDISVVNTEFKRLGCEIFWPENKICTVEATEWIKGYRLSLSLLHEHLFGEKFTGAHRARIDVEALARCFFELRKRGYV